MGKYIGTGVKPRIKLKGQYDTSRLDKIAAERESAEVAIDAIQTKDQQEVLGVNPYAGVEEFGAATGTTREQIAQDPALYQDFQDVYDQPVGSQTDLGTGPGYTQKTEAGPSPIGDINTALERYRADPNDQAALAILQEHAPKERAISTTDQYRTAVDVEGMARPGYEKQIIGADASIDMIENSYKMGRRVQAVFDDMAFKYTPEEASAMATKIAAEEDIELNSFKDLMNGFVSTYGALTEADGRAQQALSDLAMHSVLYQARDAEAKAAKDEKTWDSAESRLAARKQSKAGKQATIGKIIEDGMGVKGTGTSTAALGALADFVVQKAFPELFQDGKLKTDRETYSELDKLNEMSAIVIPSARREVRTEPKLDLKGEQKRSNIKKPRRGDKDYDYLNYDFVNETTDTLDNISYTVDQNLRKVIENLVGVVDENGETVIDKLLKITSVESVVGESHKGTLNNRDLARDKVVKDKDGNFKIGKDGQPITESYLGNVIKDYKFNETMDWAAKHTGLIFYDYFFAGNGRFNVDQTVGNYQADKLSRALLQAAKAEIYSVTEGSQELIQLQAGIMKKHSLDKAGVADAARAFTESARRWQKMVGPDGSILDGQALIKEVSDHEGWMSLSAVVEGAKLQYALDNAKRLGLKKVQYKSKFFTEVDGVANGLGHNALQSGDLTTAMRTNLNPGVANVAAGTGKTGIEQYDDVYYQAGQVAAAAINEFTGDNEYEIKKVFKALTNKENGVRAFAKNGVMIFGYGASAGTIIGDTYDYVMGEYESRAEVKQQVDDIIGSSDTDLETVFNAIAESMVGAVETSFPHIKELAVLLSAIAEEAAVQGLDPKLVTVEGHAILLGLKSYDVNEEGRFLDPETGVLALPAKSKLDPKGRYIKETEGTFGRKARPGETRKITWKGRTFQVPAGNLKASTQAAVLPTHHNDGINIGKTFNHFKNNPDMNIAAQVFDGVMTTPKRAAATAKQLNKDFVAINREVSNLKRLKQALDAQNFNWSRSKKTNALRRRLDKLEVQRMILLKQITSSGVKQFFWD